MEIASSRLWNQHLTNPDLESPPEVVRRLGAVQAQDFAAAKWAVGLRMGAATDETVERSFNEGLILRTHVMRPTWHFVGPEDIRWMLELTSSRVKARLAPYDRRLGHTAGFYAKCNSAIEKAFRIQRYPTRSELAVNLEKNKIAARGQRLGHILVNAELDGLICSGPRRGKQHTYALLADRVPAVKKIGRDEALARLAIRYFGSHGPAQLVDFAWWSGLSIKDAGVALDLAATKLARDNGNGKTYWSSPGTGAPPSLSPRAFLLSIYDEYTIAYRDRTDISDRRAIERMIAMGNAATAVLVMNGRVAGTWKRVLKKARIEITVNPFRKLTGPEREALESAAARYGEFMRSPVFLTPVGPRTYTAG
jgi:hypothetical protein